MQNILAVDQSMQSSGWAYQVGGDIISAGYIRTRGLTDLAAMQYQRDKVRELVLERTPSLVIFEDVHFGKNVATLKKLGGLLYMMRDMCSDLEIPHVVITSPDVVKHLKLKVARSNSKIKHLRAIAFAASLLWGDINRSPNPENPIQDDAASAIVLLDCHYFRQTDKHLVCIDPAAALAYN